MPEIIVESYRELMTTPAEVRIAGVPWPAYKLVALAVGVLVLIGVAAVTGTAATSVLAAAATTTLIWLTWAFAARPR